MSGGGNGLTPELTMINIYDEQANSKDKEGQRTS